MDIVQVYLLYRVNINNGHTRPRAIPFSSKEKMHKHITEMIMKCDRIEQRFRNRLEEHLASNNWTGFIEIFRQAQVHNNQNIGFDLYWEEEPQVLL